MGTQFMTRPAVDTPPLQNHILISQYKYCDRKTLNPKIIIYPIGRSQNVKKTTKKAEKKRKILFRIKTDCDHSIVMKSNLSSYLDELRELVSSDFFHQKS